MGHCWHLVVCLMVLVSRDVACSLVTNLANDRVVKIWSPITGELIRNLNGHTKGLSDIAWSADSVYLASASDDHTVRIWDVDSVSIIFWRHLLRLNSTQGLTTRVLKGHSSFVFCVNYNVVDKVSTLLASGGCDGDIRIWNASKGTFVQWTLQMFYSSMWTHKNREMYQDNTCPSRLCHRCSFQQGWRANRLLCL